MIIPNYTKKTMLHGTSKPWESCHACYFCRISFDGRQGLNQLILHPFDAVENFIAKTILPDAIPNVLHRVEFSIIIL